MPTYKFQALDANTQKKVRGQVDANSHQAAAESLVERNLNPIRVTEKKQISFATNKPRIKDQVVFSRQMSTLIGAGLPILASLQHVSGQTKNKLFRQIIDDIRSRISGGESFAEAIGRYPDHFNRTYINMIEAGEQSGNLDVGMNRLAEQQEKEHELRRKVTGALVYPTIIGLVIIGVIIFMLNVVIPEIRTIYEELGSFSDLPRETRFLIWLSEVTNRFWYAVLTFFICAAIGIGLYRKTNPGKRQIALFKLKAPLIGNLMSKLYMSQFSRRMEMMLMGGVNYIRTLEIIADGMDNIIISEAVARASEEVKGGTSLTDALGNEPVFLSLLVGMIRIGEESGSLTEMLNRAGDYYEREVENAIKQITALIEPVLMLLVGGVAIFIIYAVFMPIYNISQNTSI